MVQRVGCTKARSGVVWTFFSGSPTAPLHRAWLLACDAKKAGEAAFKKNKGQKAAAKAVLRQEDEDVLATQTVADLQEAEWTDEAISKLPKKALAAVARCKASLGAVVPLEGTGILKGVLVTAVKSSAYVLKEREDCHTRKRANRARGDDDE